MNKCNYYTPETHAQKRAQICCTRIKYLRRKAQQTYKFLVQLRQAYVRGTTRSIASSRDGQTEHRVATLQS